jgi:DNA-directed RNA polymerase specialized sigma24 family protein
MDQNEQINNAALEARVVLQHFLVKYRTVPLDVIVDAVAETQAQWYEALCLGNIDHPDSPRGWITIAASRLIRDWRKREQRMGRIDDLREELAEEDSEIALFEDHQDVVTLIHTSGLDGGEFALVVLRLMALSYEEISKMHSEHPPVEVLRQQCHRAHEKIKERVRAEQKRVSGECDMPKTGKFRSSKNKSKKK